ncbi:MAG: metallophosphoesterase [Candidatus Margulisiibacteriota bacterium]
MSEFHYTPQPPQEENKIQREKIINLKGGGSFGPFQFRGGRVDVWLGDQLFQIIEADPRMFNAPYLLIDPKTFNPENPQTGFKGLWDGQEIIFGRDYHLDRFEYSPYVSRNHVSISVGEGKITIRDLNSKNGTIIVIREEEEIPSERPKGPELLFELAGKRSAREVLALISTVEEILAQEEKQGAGKLGRTIQETKDSQSGNEYFVDGKIAYLPPRGQVVFIGDTHGDSLSTEAIVRQVRFIEEMEGGNKDFYLVFLGDYVDRGNNDVRNLEMALELKARYPRNVILMMGNHEEGGGILPYELPESLRRHFGDAGNEVHEAYIRLFRKLPNVLVTGNGIVALHAGVPNANFTTLNLQTLRNNEALFKQIRWNDPDPRIQGFEPNPERGEDIYRFGKGAFEEFMRRVGGRVMVRSHEPKPNGYELLFGGRLVTIFSTGRGSRESGYKEGVKTPTFMWVLLTKQISTIDPQRHISISTHF